MHIPDGYLSPGTCAALTAAAVPAWAVAARRLRARLGGQELPNLALASAFSFVIMMFNVPALGTSGHAVGAGLVAVTLGPEAAIVTTTIALAIQALLFGDGGVLAFGANAFNMAILMPLATYALYRVLAAGAPSPRRRAVAAGLAGYVGLNVAALATAVELGLQPALAHAADGAPLYCPFGLAVAVPAMMLPHLLVFGVIEGAVTAGVVTAAARAGHAFEGGAVTTRAGVVGWAAMGLLCLLSPLGLLTAGQAWAEWGADDLQTIAGVRPAGLSSLDGWWRPLLPDYLSGSAAGYVLSAVVGVAAIALVVLALRRLLARPSSMAPSATVGAGS